MCGIVGIVSQKNVAKRLVDALKKLEYRGYDSAGIAVIDRLDLKCQRAVGKISNLEQALLKTPIDGTVGIGHTRWATHGRPTSANAHPHQTEDVALVHNGIIENFTTLKTELIEKGHTFQSETDSEVIAHLISAFLHKGLAPLEAMFETIKKLEGAYALCVLFKGHARLMICARRGSPMAIGYGNQEVFVASDAIALAPFTYTLTYLQEGDFALIQDDQVTFYDGHENIVERAVQTQHIEATQTEKGTYAHYMEKEIFEQPQVIQTILDAYLDREAQRIKLPVNTNLLLPISRLTIVACGTSFYAGSVAKYWLETLTRIPTEVDIASEFRYRAPPLPAGGLAIFISQSGETADTLAAMRYAKEQNQMTLGIVNVMGSSLARECDLVLNLHAGPEIGVASTKAFTAQLTVLLCFAIQLGLIKSQLTSQESTLYVHHLLSLPSLVRETLQLQGKAKGLAHDLQRSKDMIYIGRHQNYPMALEGALKMKEITYIHAEAYAGGELKHGPIALVDEIMPIIALAPMDRLFDKMLSNIQEVSARKGKIILLTDAPRDNIQNIPLSGYLQIPVAHPLLHPLLMTIPLQLLAYETAVAKGNDVDQPRNLAKSVTVE